MVEVDDPFGAAELAQKYLADYPVPVVAITGSNGKTSTKDMIKQVLSTKWSVHATEGNHNNEIGVPLTVLGLDEHHEIWWWKWACGAWVKSGALQKSARRITA